MENERRHDNIDDIEELSKKYSHYLDPDSVEDTSTVETGGEDSASETPVEAGADGETDNKDEFQDIYSNSDGKSAKNGDGKNFFTWNKGRNIKIIALCLVIALLLTGAGFLIYLVLATRSDGYNASGIDYGKINEDDYLDDTDVNFNAMGDVNADSLNDFLYKWANNGGEKMYSKNVINVLLCGVDSKSGNASDGRSDSMILISVNKKTETITMVSLLRDSWTYIKAPKEDGTTYDYYFKMNAAYSLGGPKTLLETVENNFKIKIDNFIAVDFVSFPKLIDALGGVTVEVQDYEANYIRRTSSQTNFPKGVATLNGKQALIYSRIRHSDSDSDVSRTRRQRPVIKALIEAAKNATNGQLVNAFRQVSGYMRTGFTQSEVLKLIAQAYSHKWMEFEMKEFMLPNEDYVDRLSTYVGSQSAWVVDYALCAQKLQNAIYGKTNIILDADRRSALDLVTNKRTTGYYSDSGNSGGSGSSGSSGSSSYSYSGGSRSGSTGSSSDYVKPTARYYGNDDSDDVDDSDSAATSHSSSGGDSGSSGEAEITAANSSDSEDGE